MGRHKRMRLVKQTPNNFYFKDIDPSLGNSVIVTIAEFEAMRLKHYIELNQKDCSEKIGVSQPTFSRILESAHKKITEALMEGKTIKVHGGNVNFKKGFIGYGCLACDNEWEDENASENRKIECPKCNYKFKYSVVKRTPRGCPYCNTPIQNK